MGNFDSHKKDVSRHAGAAGRAVEGIVPDTLVPWGKTNADCRFSIMDTAVHFPVISPVIEWAVGEGPAIRINPVIDPGNTREIRKGNIFAGPPSSRKPYPDVPEDILAIIADPWDKILRYPFLSPSPLLAAFSALLAVLIRYHSRSSVKSIDRT